MSKNDGWPTCPLRLVRWVDARGASTNWMPVAEATEGVCEIRSVGYVISDDGECVVVAPHMTEEQEPDTVGVMYIPRMAIREVMALQVSEDGFPFTPDQLNRGGGTTVRMDFVEGGEPTSEDADLRGELEEANATAEAEVRAAARARKARDEAFAEVERLRKGIEREAQVQSHCGHTGNAKRLRDFLEGGGASDKPEPSREVDDAERQAFRAGYDKGWEDRATQPDTHMVANYSPNFRWLEYRDSRKGGGE